MAKLGTPENPEIIEPGVRPRRPVAPPLARLRTALKLLKSLIVVVAPALLLDSALLTLLIRGWREQNAILFLFGLLLVPMAALASTLALVAGPLLLVSLIFLVMGRAVGVSPRPFGRFEAQFKRFSGRRT